MLRKTIGIFCLCLLLTGCGVISGPDGSTVVVSSSGAALSSDDAAAIPAVEGAYWTVDVPDGTVSLRDGAEAETLELVLSRLDGITVLKTFDPEDDYYSSAEQFTAQSFTDIMGYDGFFLRQTSGVGFRMTTYYTLEEDQLRPIGESFGYDLGDDGGDTVVDLDGDGVTELVTNNTYGGDGYQAVYVFRRQGEDVQEGSIDLDSLEMPGFDNWGVNSTAEYFDAGRQVFKVDYAVKNQEDYSTVEFTDLSHFTFESIYGSDQPDSQ